MRIATHSICHGAKAPTHAPNLSIMTGVAGTATLSCWRCNLHFVRIRVAFQEKALFDLCANLRRSLGSDAFAVRKPMILDRLAGPASCLPPGPPSQIERAINMSDAHRHDHDTPQISHFSPSL